MARAYDGTVSVVQPLIEPLYGGKTAHENRHDSCRTVGPDRPRSGGSSTGRNSKSVLGICDFEASWRKSLHDGWVAGTTYAPKPVALKTASFPVSQSATALATKSTSAAIPPSMTGVFSNNGWLQELPKPLTKLTWDNPIMIGPAMPSG